MKVLVLLKRLGVWGFTYIIRLVHVHDRKSGAPHVFVLPGYTGGVKMFTLAKIFSSKPVNIPSASSDVLDQTSTLAARSTDCSTCMAESLFLTVY